MASSLGDLCSCADASLPQWQCQTHGSVDPALVAAADDAAIEADMAIGAAFLGTCTCTVSTITLRRERAGDCPVHLTRRVTFDSIAWERIPEQAVCICAHVKGVHYNVEAYPNRFACQTFRPGVSHEGDMCRCPGFHDVDHPTNWSMFADRLLHEVPEYAEMKDRLLDAVTKKRTNKSEHSNPNARARLALGWSWKQSGLDLTEPRTWALWMADSKRVWHAWRDAGSPITAFGKQTSFGVAEIPAALEDR